MQEEIVDKSIDVAARITSLTLSQILKALDAIAKGLEKKPDEKTPDLPQKPKEAKEPDAPKEPELKHGKQTLKELHKHNEGLAVIELKDPNLRDLHKFMKKADIDFSCVKDGKGKYTLFFKGSNADEMTHAFKRYTEKMLERADKKAHNAEQKEIKAELREAKAAAKALDKEQKNEIKAERRELRAERKADQRERKAERKAEKREIKAENKAIKAELREAKAAAKALDKGRSKEKNKSRGARDR